MTVSLRLHPDDSLWAVAIHGAYVVALQLLPPMTTLGRALRDGQTIGLYGNAYRLSR